MNEDRHIPLGSLQHRVMTAVAQLAREDAYGLSIRRLIETRVGRAPADGALYITLARLERRGFVRSAESEARPIRGGRRRRLYELTGTGRAALGVVERGLAAMKVDSAERPDNAASTPST